MAYVPGNIDLSSNIQLSKHSPLDARQVVGTNIDLNDIGGFPYDGLVIHVKDTDKTYVCIDETKAKNGLGVTDPGGVIDETVWKELGAGSAAAAVLDLPDQYPAPSAIAQTSRVFSYRQRDDETRPDFLYRFDEGVNDADAVDDGRLQSPDGTKYNTDGGGFGIATGGAFGNSAQFIDGKGATVSVGTKDAAAPFYFTSDTGDRGDFEIQFRFRFEALEESYCLVSTDVGTPANVQTEGFYAILLGTHIADPTIVFQYTRTISWGISSTTAMAYSTWRIPGTIAVDTDYHLSLSFMEDDRTYEGSSVGDGRLRCYWNGAVLEDHNVAGSKSIVVDQFNNIGRNASTSTTWPVNIAQYADGVTAPSPNYFFHGQIHEYAVYNHRCLHNTSDTFQIPSAPTRDGDLSMPSVVDSDGTTSPIITTSNAGVLLPKAIEGLADGSLWNDKGTVKVAPFTGDLDAGEGVLSLPAGTAPTAEAGVAKIYAKSVAAASGGDALYNFTSGAELVDEIGSATASIPQGPEDGGDRYVSGSTGGTGWTGFGQQLRIDNGTANQKYPASNCNRYIIPNPGLGTGSFTIEFFYNPNYSSGTWPVFSIGRDNTYSSSLQFFVSSGQAFLSDFDSSAGTNSGNGRQHQFNTNASPPNFPWGSYNGAATHYAIVREVTSGSAAWYLYLNGTRYTSDWQIGFGSNTQVTDYVGDMSLGSKYYYSSGYHYSHAALSGYFDSLRITKSALYTASSITVPTAPFTNPPPTTKLFCMDADGNETQLTP